VTVDSPYCLMCRQTIYHSE